MSRQRGVALLVVLVILLAVGGSSTAFIWFMQQQQTRAGVRYRPSAFASLAGRVATDERASLRVK